MSGPCSGSVGGWVTACPRSCSSDISFAGVSVSAGNGFPLLREEKTHRNKQIFRDCPGAGCVGKCVYMFLFGPCLTCGGGKQTNIVPSESPALSGVIRANRKFE